VYDVLHNSPFFRAFLVTADVPEIYMQEFWAMAKLHQHSIRFKMDTKRSVLDLEAFREMLHINFVYQVEHKNQKRSNEMYYPRFTKVIINYFMTRKPSIPRRNRINWHYVRDDVLFSTIKVYACATGEAALKPKASARKKKGDSASSTTPPTTTPTTTVVAAPRLSATAKGKQPARATTPTELIDVERTEAEQLKITRVPDVPYDDSEEELSWNSFDDEDVDEQTKGREESEGDKTDESDDGNDDDNDETVKAGSDKDDDDNDDEEELAKNDDEDTESGKGGNEVSESKGESEEEETRQEEEESFDPIPRTPEGSEDEGNDEEDQELRLNSHVTLTPVHPDGPQESSSVLSFVTSMQNPISDAGVESIFTTASSSIVSLQTPTPIMTPSTIATITTSRDAPIPPTTIPSIILENLPTFNSAFRFDERLRSLETTFSEYRQTNPFVDTDRLQDSLQRENDEFLRNIDENMKKIIKGQVKSQVKEQVSCILPRIKESVNATLEAEVLTISSHFSRTSYAIAADLSEMELKKILIEKMEGKKSI
nr:hypothetical protein [Tanacetum cinerariifolium]